MEKYKSKFNEASVKTDTVGDYLFELDIKGNYFTIKINRISDGSMVLKLEGAGSAQKGIKMLKFLKSDVRYFE